ncbi:MAG: N-acyl-D-amino acid deacylase [Planctomycetaceae bacterium]|nr:N-acyl-D-amino acid deacylase [Planctomycetaceae bacterium]
MRQFGFIVLASLAWLSTPVRSADPVVADVLLVGGTIHDGTGRQGFAGDVAIRGDRVVAVGTFETKSAEWRLDCRGLVVMPGAIDLHNHSDRQVVDSRTRACVNYLLQGCTTIVTGNCGGGPVDVGDYYQKIDQAGAGANVVHLLPHGALRRQVVGTERRAATKAELKEMQLLAEQAMTDGAWGMSTGLIYVPGTYADTEELVSLAQVVARHKGIYASHIRNENVRLLAAVDEAMEIGRRAGLPVHVSHFKSSGRGSWGLVRRAAERIAAARKKGQKVTADQYPYIASSTSLDATVIPTWARAGGRKELIRRLDDKEIGVRLRAAIAENLSRKENGQVLKIARYSPRSDWVGKSVAEIAELEKLTTVEVAVQVAKNGGAAIVNFSMSEEDVRHIMQVPWVATASDGRAYLPGADRPHPRSYGTFARKLGHYAIREKVLGLPAAVRSMTGLPAEILGLTDRGVVRAGMVADVAVFDPRRIRDAATFEDPHQFSEGFRYVFVNGRPAVYRGKPTGALAGRAVVHSTGAAK